MSWLGYVVKEISDESPRGKKISAPFQIRLAAETYAELAAQQAKRDGREARYVIEEKTRDDG